MDDKLEQLISYGFKRPEPAKEGEFIESMSNPFYADVFFRLIEAYGPPEVYTRFPEPHLSWRETPVGKVTYHPSDDNGFVSAYRSREWNTDKRLQSWEWWIEDPDLICVEEFRKIDKRISVEWDEIKEEAAAIQKRIRKTWPSAWDFSGSLTWRIREDNERPGIAFMFGGFRALDSFHLKRNESVWRGEMRTDEGLGYYQIEGSLDHVLLALLRFADNLLSHDRRVLDSGKSPGLNLAPILSELDCEFV